MPQKIKTAKTAWRTKPPRKDHSGFYSTAAWKTLRRVKLKQNPICECTNGPEGTSCGEFAVDAHHIIDIAERWDLRLRLDNLQSLSKSCHSKITKERMNNQGDRQ